MTRYAIPHQMNSSDNGEHNFGIEGTCINRGIQTSTALLTSTLKYKDAPAVPRLRLSPRTPKPNRGCFSQAMPLKEQSPNEGAIGSSSFMCNTDLLILGRRLAHTMRPQISKGGMESLPPPLNSWRLIRKVLATQRQQRERAPSRHRTRGGPEACSAQYLHNCIPTQRC